MIPFGTSHLDPQRIGADSGLSSTATGPAPFVEEALRWLPGAAQGEPALARTVGESPESPGRWNGEALPRGQRARIVWADDNADLRDYVSRLLGERSEVEAVADGEAAQVEGVEAGADDYLIKPFSARELLARVGTHLGMARIRREAARREHELRAKTQRHKDFLERIVDNAPVAIAIMRGQELEYVSVNAAYQAITGPDAQFVGRTYRDVFPQAADRGAEEGLREVMRSGRPWKVRDFQTEIPGRPGMTWWNGECLPLPNEPGEIDAVLVLTWEVTERKQTELLLREQATLLERIASGCSLDECFVSLCDRMPKLDPGARACVLLADDERRHQNSV